MYIYIHIHISNKKHVSMHMEYINSFETSFQLGCPSRRTTTQQATKVPWLMSCFEWMGHLPTSQSLNRFTKPSWVCMKIKYIKKNDKFWLLWLRTSELPKLHRHICLVNTHFQTLLQNIHAHQWFHPWFWIKYIMPFIANLPTSFWLLKHTVQ